MAERLEIEKPLRAPPGCRFCYDETDFGSVLICRAVAEVYGEPVQPVDAMQDIKR